MVFRFCRCRLQVSYRCCKFYEAALLTMCENFVFLSPYDLPDRHIARNFEYANELVKQGDCVTILVNNFSHRDKKALRKISNKYFLKEEYEGLTVIWLNTPKYTGNGWMRGINALSFFLLSLRYIIFNVSGRAYFIGDSVPPFAALSAMFAAFIKRGHFIYQIRDVWPIALVYDRAIKKHSLIYLALRFLEIIFYKISYKIITALPLVTDHVKKSGGNVEKLIYLPNGTHTNIISNNPKCDNECFTIIYGGGFGNAHDVETIIKAASVLQAEGASVRFKLYGEGVKKKPCELLQKQLKVDNVLFLSTIDKLDLHQEIVGSDLGIAVVTASQAYKFGINLNKLYDYMSASTPILLSIDSPHRLIEDANCGLMIEPENVETLVQAIKDFMKMDPIDRQILGANGFQYARKHFAIDKLTSQLKQQLLNSENL